MVVFLRREGSDMVDNLGRDEIINLLSRRRKKKTEEHYVDLQGNEKVLVRAAAAIYAAYVSSGGIPEGREDEYLSRSIDEALKIALRIEELVRDAEEPGGES
jgi:hypothetical protein